MPASINISFSLGGTTITIPGPPGPTEIAPSARFITDLSANHSRWTYQLTKRQKFLWSIQLADLTEAHRAALQGFFENIAEGPNNQFTYTHTDGATYTARFTDPVLKFVRANPETWAVGFTLEFDSMSWSSQYDPATTTTTTAAPTTTTTSTTTTTTAAP